MTALIALLLAAAQPGAPQTLMVGSPLGPHADVVFGAAFLTDDDPRWLEIEWLDKPSQARVSEAVPVKPGQFGMVELRCGGLTRDGKLSACTINDDPSGAGYHEAGEKLMGSLSVTEAFRKRVANRLKFIDVQLRLSNSDTDLVRGPCWPPRCVAEPGPPPSPSFSAR